MKRVQRKNKTRIQRAHSVRAHVISENPKARFSIFRSNNNLYVQIIDDIQGKTLVSGSLKEVKGAPASPKTRLVPSSERAASRGARIEKAHHLGKLMAEKAKKAGVSHVVFDRGRYAYHGRVKALAEGAREGGLKF